MQTTRTMPLGDHADHIDVGDLIEANGETAVVLELISPRAPGPGHFTDRMRILSEDGRVWGTRRGPAAAVTWRIINEGR